LIVPYKLALARGTRLTLGVTYPHKPTLFLETPSRNLRDSAAKIRASASLFTDEQIKRLLIELAETYEQLAANASNSAAG
jgi:hypothetical protein